MFGIIHKITLRVAAEVACGPQYGSTSRSHVHPGVWVMLGCWESCPAPEASALLVQLQESEGSSRRRREKGIPNRVNAGAGQVGGGDTASVLGGPCHAAAIPRLLSASLTLLSHPSCPPCPSCPRPLCPGAALPAPGGSGGSVNGYHTCKGELAVGAAEPRPFFCPCIFHSLGIQTSM